LIAGLTIGKKLNYFSLRVYATILFQYKNNDFDIDYARKQDAKASIFYKDNEKTKPKNFFFEYTEDVIPKVETILKFFADEDYVRTDIYDKPFALFFKGHVNACYTTFTEMWTTCLSNGNMKLKKKDYEDPKQRYKLKAVIQQKDFVGTYLWMNTRIELKSLQMDKNPDANLRSRSECVVCLEGESEYAIIPCGHLCLCSSQECRSISSCPLCRGPVNSINKIF